MRLKDFEAKGREEKKDLEKKLDSFKLEKVLSLWYVVQTSAKATVAGSKG